MPLGEQSAKFAMAASEKVKQAMRELGDGSNAFGLIHADLHKHNTLFSGKEARVIDFDDCGFGHRIYDFAVCLWENKALNLRDSLFEGYACHRPVPKDQLEFLDAFIAARQISNAVWVFEQAKENPDSQINVSQGLDSTAQGLQQYLNSNP